MRAARMEAMCDLVCVHKTVTGTWFNKTVTARD